MGAWTLFGLAALAASLINPYGVQALVFPFHLMGVENLSRVSEWQPQDFSHIGPMEIALIMLIGFALTRPIAAPLIRTALLILLIVMALEHVRHQLLLGLLAPMLLARPVAKAIGQEPAEDWRRIALIALAATAAACLAVGAARLLTPVERVDGTAAPISALKAVPPELKARPVLNQYGFGGYLIWSHVRPFIDARADMYGDAMLSLYGKLVAGDPATVETRAHALRRRLDDLRSRRSDRRDPRPRARLAAPLRRRLCGRPCAGRRRAGGRRPQAGLRARGLEFL